MAKKRMMKSSMNKKSSSGPVNGRMQNVPMHTGNRPVTDSAGGNRTTIVKKY